VGGGEGAGNICKGRKERGGRGGTIREIAPTTHLYLLPTLEGDYSNTYE